MSMREKRFGRKQRGSQAKVTVAVDPRWPMEGKEEVFKLQLSLDQHLNRIRLCFCTTRRAP
jgi:hypothetical protein